MDRAGLIYGLVAYGWWGLVPLYFRLFRGVVPSLEILAHRVLWSALVLAGVLTLVRRWRDFVSAVRDQKLLFTLVFSALLIGVNWYVYILSVETHRIVQASLGYFITPLMSVALGMAFFRETLRPMQVRALILAVLGVAVLAVQSGQMPWLALTLATSFSLYGLLRKKTPIDGLMGLMIETVILVPVASAYFLQQANEGTLTPWFTTNWLLIALILAGPVTAVPLICFAQAARKLPLSTLGFMQYFSPTIQFLIAVLLFGETLPPGGEVAFPLIWLALVLFSIDTWRVAR